MILPEWLMSEPSVKRPAKLHKIVVMDTGFNSTKNSRVKLCDTGSADFTHTGLKDNHGHGSHVANTIADRLLNADKYCFIIVKAFDPNTPLYYRNVTSRVEFEYLDTILEAGDYVNYSAGGGTPGNEEKQHIVSLLNKGVNIFVAAGNGSANLDKKCDYYPACYGLKNLHVVGNLYNFKTKAPSSNYGRVVTEWEIGINVVADNGTGVKVPMTGTSQATALATVREINRNAK